jgi:hypothetical protein
MSETTETMPREGSQRERRDEPATAASGDVFGALARTLAASRDPAKGLDTVISALLTLTSAAGDVLTQAVRRLLGPIVRKNGGLSILEITVHAAVPGYDPDVTFSPTHFYLRKGDQVTWELVTGGDFVLEFFDQWPFEGPKKVFRKGVNGEIKDGLDDYAIYPYRLISVNGAKIAPQTHCPEIIIQR